ncbi:MAG: DEDD exonuclease domain-containing protein [Acidimicrobiales bacterium]
MVSPIPRDAPAGRQLSFDSLGTPLADVTFCVLDLETTGGSPETCGITEIGAVKVRGGEVLGTFQTLVNPGCTIPPNVAVLTGLTDAIVHRAPPVDAVLPTFLEFIGGAVIVGHNVRFDHSFLQHAIYRYGGPLLGNQRLDTLALARRLLADEVPKFALGELATRLRLPHQPTHRALDDAWATVDLLHLLIERASSWGVTGLDDLVNLPTIAGHPQWRKLSLTSKLPRKPGVYRFLDANGRVLYVGKATDLRARVRSYFSSDQRRKVAQLLRETADIAVDVTESTLEAEILELRAILAEQPRFNSRGKRAAKPCWVQLTTSERFPLLSITTSAPSSAVAIGPLTSRKQAALVVDAIHGAIPLRRCTTRISRTATIANDGSACSPFQLGTAACPCHGATSEAGYADIVALAARAMSGDYGLILDPLEAKMRQLAEAERFEEAADYRNRAGALAAAVQRQQRASLFQRVERLTIETADGITIELGNHHDQVPSRAEPGQLFGTDERRWSVDLGSLDEVLCAASWLERNACSVRVVRTEGTLSSPYPPLPSYQPPASDRAVERPLRRRRTDS